MSWTKEAWAAALPAYSKILEQPFLKELLDGSLPREKFVFYLRQDALYLAEFGRALAGISSRLSDLSESEAFLGFARDTMLVERALHESYLKNESKEQPKASPSCLLYTAYVQRQLSGPVEVSMAAVLPCFWVYKEVGDHLLGLPSAPDNPYQPWIDTYGGEEYAAAVKRCMEICDRAAAQASQAVRASMTEVYIMGTRMEWMFWNSAYQMEEWPV